MSTIGPRFPAPHPPASQGQAGSPRTAAQKAFFAAALGQAAPAAQPAPTRPKAEAATSPPVVHATRVQTTEIPQGESPARILRPGSIIDIRV